MSAISNLAWGQALQPTTISIVRYINGEVLKLFAIEM